MSVQLKDPDAVIDYQFDWSNYLPSGDTIATSSWSVAPTGELAIDSDSNTATTATAFVSGGVVRKTYRLVNQIVTAGARTEERSIIVRVGER